MISAPALGDRDHLWRALSLDERIALLRTVRVDGRERPTHDPETVGGDDALLDRWRAMYPDARAFARRLSWMDTAPDTARAAVSSRPPAGLTQSDLRGAANTPSPWTDTLEQIVQALGHPLPAPPEAAWLDVPFVHLWSALLPSARQRLRGGLVPEAHAVLSRPLVAGLERLLLLRLSRVSAPVLYHGFTLRRPPGSRLEAFSGTPSSAYYTRYVDAIRSDGGTALFARYPVLARLVAHTVDCWVNASTALVVRLARDHEALANTFGGGTSIGPVISFEAPLSDPHAGHQVVCRLLFENGLALAYKPRPIAMEAYLGRVTTWLGAHGIEAGMVPRAIERDGYGWMEWINTRPCSSRDARCRYFQRVGALMAILHLLRGTDAHVDNLVSHGEWPVLVDAETLGQSEATLAAPTPEHPLSPTQTPTVLRTGLLPGWHDAGKGPGREVSALGAEAPSPRTGPVEWDAVNTDGMTPSPPRVPDGPSTRTVPWGPQEHLESIDRGFTAAYDALVAGLTALLGPGGVLQRFEDHRSRFVFRPTHIYDQLRRASLSPAAMADGTARSLLFERLRVPFARLESRPAHWDVVTGEMTQLFDLDVPYFTASGHAPVIDGGVTHPVPVLRRTPIGEIRAAFDLAGPEDLALQRMLLQGSILAHAARVDVPPPPLSTASLTSTTPEALVAGATAIAGQLAARARHDVRLGTYWLGPRFTPSTGRFAFHASGESLFEGVMGTALFLHGCDWCTGDPRFGVLADQSLHSVRRYLGVAADAPSAWFARRLGIGGAFGLGSLVYGFTVLAALTQRAADLDSACAAARLITPAAVDDDRQLDVTGGAAGAVLSLLALHVATGHDWCLEIAHRCGRHLIRHAQSLPNGGLGWITTAPAPVAGFAHGGAGIALALSRLSVATGESDFADAARAGLACDDECLARETAPRPGRWCSGSAGDALARIGTSDEHARQLTNATEQVPGGDLDTLCCGLAGRVESLLVAAEVYGSPHLHAAALEGAADLASRVPLNALRCVPPLDAALVHPGLFQGAAGIGWTLLRASGAALPSVLLWEPPRQAEEKSRYHTGRRH